MLRNEMGADGTYHCVCRQASAALLAFLSRWESARRASVCSAVVVVVDSRKSRNGKWHDGRPGLGSKNCRPKPSPAPPIAGVSSDGFAAAKAGRGQLVNSCQPRPQLSLLSSKTQGALPVIA